MKLLYSFINIFRNVRSNIATSVLQYRLHKYGKSVGAARIPHISSTAKVVVGDFVGFNGVRITG